MKKFSKLAIAGIAGIAILVGAFFGYSQTQFNELYDIVFRPQNPQIRWVGNLSFRNLAGTEIATVNSITKAMAGFTQPVTVGIADTYALAATDCGRVYVATKTSATQTYTLPAVTTAGCMFTFIAGDAGGEILIDGAEVSGTSITITTFGAVGTDADTAIVTDTDATPGIKNTANTNAVGDSVTLVSNGVATWLGVGITSGIWAAQ